MKLPILAAALLALLATNARATTGAELFLSPFNEGKSLEISGDAYAFPQANTDGGAASHHLTLDIFQSAERWQILAGNKASPVVGHDLTYLNVVSDSPTLARHYLAESVGIGQGIAEFGQWQFALTAGVGYAGSNPYADGNALFGKASFIANDQLNAHENLVLYLQYDGNDTLFPDFPYPGIAYGNTQNPNLQYLIGLPFSAVTWKPINRLTLEAQFQLPTTLQAAATYAMTHDVDLFAAYHDNETAFFEDHGNARTFFIQQQLELGVKYRPVKWGELTLGAGYAFGTEFRRGFSDRNLHTLLNISDAPFLHLGFALNF